MALRVQAGNRPKLDDDGFVHGVIKSIDMEDSAKVEWESLRWEFETLGTLRPMTFRLWSGLTYNPPDEKGEASRLTTLCLRFNLLTMEQLLADEIPEIDLETLIGQCVQFKLVREDKLYRIDVDTLALESGEPEVDEKPKTRGK